MINIAELVGALSKYLEAQRQLELCRQQATGDVEYYSYGYTQDLKQAEANLEQQLNDFIDQRVDEKMANRDYLHQARVPADISMVV
jgi:hypothetical protein